MKIHVFVATTQGLVAIQRIYPLRPGISSVVSINGTSTMANISSAYHNFVAEGAGIIEQDFGSSSYRVNVSHAIDQGNSWQLGFYLAHNLSNEFKNVESTNLSLGNGVIEEGDLVICATGEINTSDRTILAVSEIPKKLKITQALMPSFKNAGTVLFMQPSASAITQTNDFGFDIKTVSTLKEATDCINKLYVECGNQYNEDEKLQDGATHTNTSSNEKYAYMLAAVIPIVAIIVYFNWPLFGKAVSEKVGNEKTANDNGADSLFESPKSITPLPTLVSKQPKTTNKATNTPHLTRLKAIYAKSKFCGGESSQITINTSNSEQIKETTLKQLCELQLTVNKTTQQVFLLPLDSLKLITLDLNQNRANIPAPDNQISTRQYFLILVEKLFTFEELIAFKGVSSELQELNNQNSIEENKDKLVNWLSSRNIEHAVYSHSLTSPY